MPLPATRESVRRTAASFMSAWRLESHDWLRVTIAVAIGVSRDKSSEIDSRPCLMSAFGLK